MDKKFKTFGIFDGKFGKVRVFEDEKKQPWFVAKVITEAMGYADNYKALRNHVSSGDHCVVNIEMERGCRRTLGLINEAGIRHLASESRFPVAREVCDWVTRTVLPMFYKDRCPRFGDEVRQPMPVSAQPHPAPAVPHPAPTTAPTVHQHDDEKVILTKAVQILTHKVEEKDKVIEEQNEIIRAFCKRFR